MECIPSVHLKWLGLRDKQSDILRHTPLMQLAMKFAPILAVAGVRLIYIAVATFEFGEDAAFIDYSRTAIVSQRTKEILILAVFLI